MAGTPLLTAEDRAHLDRARLLAREGWGRVHPNPMVGCVLVRDGEVVGEGFHREFGGPHAEILALEAAGSRADGAAAYVSLEPCDHFGKTPPCTQALIQAGVVRVVFGARDPGARSGGGGETLRRAGVAVAGPTWTEAQARAENPAFHHTTTRGTPFVAVKLAQTLDGAIADAPGRRSRITGPEAEQEVHRLRTGFDAVLVGAGTARTDDPRLTVRLVEPGRAAPARLVLSPDGDLPSDAALLRDAPAAAVHVFTRSDVRELELERLEGAGAHVHPVPAGTGGLDLKAVLAAAWGLGMRSVLCEGGGRVASALLRAGLAQRLYLWIAPYTNGPGGVEAFPGVTRDVWDRFHPAFPPELHGRDTLLVLDERPA